MSDLSHPFGKVSEQHAVTCGPAGLVPPPALNWVAWRASVKAAKESRGISINKLAQRSGLDRSTVIELLGGRRGVEGVRIDSLWALAWALETDPASFPDFLAPLMTPSGPNDEMTGTQSAHQA